MMMYFDKNENLSFTGDDDITRFYQVGTDVSSLPKYVRDECEARWTPEVVLAAQEARAQSDASYIAMHAPPTLDQLKQDAKSKVIAFADSVAARVTKNYPRAESDAFIAKKLEAQSVIASDSIVNASLLAKFCTRELEAINGSFTDAELKNAVVAEANKIMAKAEVFEHISAATQHLRKTAEKAIDDCETAEAIQTVLANLQAEAEQELAAILGA
jgi:hypothetical protein